MRLMLVVLGLLLCGAASADSLLNASVSANGIWFDAVTPKPDDFELGGNAVASVQQHISLVGAAFWGFQHSYARASAGIRFTATNADDPNFSINLGGQYHVSSEPEIRPEGFAPDASIGWSPWPVQLPNVILVAQGAYFPASNQASAIAGVRLVLGGR